MNLKNLAIATATALSFAAVPMASADNTLPPLMELTPGGCSAIELNGAVQQMAAWSWEDGGDQTQFGGGAVYTVTFAINDSEEYDPVKVEVELERYAPDLPTKMVYSCPELGDMNPEVESGEVGECEARIADVDAAVEEATEAKLNELDLLGADDDLTINSSELVGVFVKAMNPGVTRGPGGRQNYEKTDVCDVPEEEPEA
jgi:hypothetical protein